MLNTFELKKLNTKDFFVGHCSFLHCSPGHNKGWRTEQRFMLRFVASGTGTFYTEQTKYPLKPGDLFIAHPRQRTLFTADTDDYVDLYLVSLSCSEPFSSLLQKDVIHIPELAPLFQKFMNCQFSNSREWAVYAVTAEMFSHLAQLQMESEKKLDPIADALHLIRNNYDRNLHVEDLAATLGMSRSYFFRLFRKEMGVSPQTYILRYRMNVAKKLLSQENMAVSDVSMQVGYEDVCTFSRLFKKHMGMTPSQYRTQNTAR